MKEPCFCILYFVFLITNDATLRKYLPNAFSTAKGETPLFDKIAPWLSASELWLVENICGEDTLAEIVVLDDMNVVKMLASQIVVSDAMRCAIPSLDLVLTPNGFGIVINTNVAPATLFPNLDLVSLCGKTPTRQNYSLHSYL